MDLSFRRTEPHDIAAAQAAYRKIIAHLAETVDFPHWHTENHPTPTEIAGWVEAGELYLAVNADENIAGVVVLNHDAVEAYQEVGWAIEAEPDNVLVVHALGVVPDHLGLGVARFLVDASIRVAQEKGCRVVRLDTYVENIPARKLYERCGFIDMGCHTLHYEGTELNQFHLFEYVLECRSENGPLTVCH